MGSDWQRSRDNLTNPKEHGKGEGGIQGDIPICRLVAGKDMLIFIKVVSTVHISMRWVQGRQDMTSSALDSVAELQQKEILLHLPCSVTTSGYQEMLLPMGTGNITETQVREAWRREERATNPGRDRYTGSTHTQCFYFIIWIYEIHTQKSFAILVINTHLRHTQTLLWTLSVKDFSSMS